MTMHAKLEHIRTTSVRLARARRERKAVAGWEAMGRRERGMLTPEWLEYFKGIAARIQAQ